MEITTVILLLIVALLVVLVVKNSQKNESITHSQLLEINENLRKEITEIRKEVGKSIDESRRETQNRLDSIRQNIQNFQEGTKKDIQGQFAQSTKLISEVTQKLTEIGATNKQVLGFAEQMRSLEKILQNPKQRGVLGEYFLETLLSNVLPPNLFAMQHRFPNGEVVDAAIFFNDMVIPIDSKFSLEKYNKMVETSDPVQRDFLEREFKADVKKRIDETSKYVRPNEGTSDFAFMFVPAEGIYYNLLIYNVGTVKINTRDLIEYAFSKRVIIVSPTSFYAYLATVIQGLKFLRIEQSVKDVIQRVELLSRHLNSFEDYLSRLGKNLGTTVSMYNQASVEFKKIDRDVLKITGSEEAGSYEPALVDKPQAFADRGEE
ncbi:MAG TPA: DNA recombination protein RmuC [Chitinophagales bacterium]|nr:DNA recombination protein RmuC [Chitinophagales bacterium]